MKTLFPPAWFIWANFCFADHTGQAELNRATSHKVYQCAPACTFSSLPACVCVLNSKDSYFTVGLLFLPPGFGKPRALVLQKQSVCIAFYSIISIEFRCAHTRPVQREVKYEVTF